MSSGEWIEEFSKKYLSGCTDTLCGLGFGEIMEDSLVRLPTWFVGIAKPNANGPGDHVLQEVGSELLTATFLGF